MYNYIGDLLNILIFSFIVYHYKYVAIFILSFYDIRLVILNIYRIIFGIYVTMYTLLLYVIISSIPALSIGKLLQYNGLYLLLKYYVMTVLNKCNNVLCMYLPMVTNWIDRYVYGNVPKSTPPISKDKNEPTISELNQLSSKLSTMYEDDDDVYSILFNK